MNEFLDVTRKKNGKKQVFLESMRRQHSQESSPTCTQRGSYGTAPTPHPTPPHSQSLPQTADEGNHLLLRNLAPNVSGSPTSSATMERGFLAGRISDGRNLEYRPGRVHAQPPTQTRLNLPGDPRVNFPSPPPTAKFYWETPRNHVAQTLAFPRNSLCEPSNNSSGVGSGHRPSPT